MTATEVKPAVNTTNSTMLNLGLRPMAFPLLTV
jgi:hypothetical protein